VSIVDLACYCCCCCCCCQLNYVAIALKSTFANENQQQVALLYGPQQPFEIALYSIFMRYSAPAAPHPSLFSSSLCWPALRGSMALFSGCNVVVTSLIGFASLSRGFVFGISFGHSIFLCQSPSLSLFLPLSFAHTYPNSRRLCSHHHHHHHLRHHLPFSVAVAKKLQRITNWFSYWLN